jgi:signal peptidase I
MSPVLQPGDYLLTLPLRPRRGDVVVFEHPHRPGFMLVKRVVGLPGEIVEISEGGVAVDGRRLAEPWTADDTHPDGRWILGPGNVFVLSDARSRSTADGRTLGPIAGGNRSDVVVLRYWPLRRAGRLRRGRDR